MRPHQRDPQVNFSIEKSSDGGSSHHMRKKAKSGIKEPNFAHFPGDSWLQVVCKGELPPSRYNMGYAVANQYLYILGGQDLNKGLYNSCWRINLATVRDHVNLAAWEKVQYRGGDSPKAISNSCMFVHNSKIFIYDINGEDPKKKKRVE